MITGLATTILLVAIVWAHRRFGGLGALLMAVVGVVIAGALVDPIHDFVVSALRVVETPIDFLQNAVNRKWK